MAGEGEGSQKPGNPGYVFNPTEHLIQIKNNKGAADYLPVQWRLVWFRNECPEGTVETEVLLLDLDRETEEEAFAWNNETRRSEKTIKRANGIAVFHAVVKDGKGGIGSGTKSEKAASFPDFIEKAETGAIGRALATLGFGTQFTGDEFDEKHRIVDAPVDHGSDAAAASPSDERKPIASIGMAPGTKPTTVQEALNTSAASHEQIASIRKLCQHLGKAEPEQVETMTYQDAKALITQLSHEYNEQKQKRKATPPSMIEEGVQQEQKKSVLDDDMLTISMENVQLTDAIITALGEPDMSHELREGFFPFCALPTTQDLYDPAFWQETGRTEKMKRFLDAWMKPGCPQRQAWRNGKITKAQFTRFKEELIPLLGDTDGEAKAELKRIRDMDKDAHGKAIGDITAATADRLIKVITDAIPDEQGKRHPEIPEEFLYKEPHVAAA